MEIPCVLFRTQDERQFSYLDDLARLTKSELETILRQSRTAVTLLEAELQHRFVTATTAPRSALALDSRLEGFYVKLRETGNLIRHCRSLPSRSEENIQTCLKILNGAKADHASKKYKSFSNDLLSSCGSFGRELLLLCAASTTFRFINITADRDVRTETSIPCLLKYPALRPLLPCTTICQTTEFVIE